MENFENTATGAIIGKSLAANIPESIAHREFTSLAGLSRFRKGLINV
jgi:hypothetical protein